MTVETRNHQHTAGNTITCKINHPKFGWIPFTAAEDDPEPFGQEVWNAVKDREDIALEAPPPPRFPTAQAALSAMRDWIERAEEQIDGGISKGERDSYLAKELEARAWVADNTADTPILSAEAAITGETMADLTLKVITKADALRPIMGEIAGLRRATEIALNAATDPADYETILDGAIQQAITLAASRGITLEP